MRKTKQKPAFWTVCLLLLVCVSSAAAQDWPQWLGPNRDCKVAGFTAPQTWPQALTQEWKVSVGQGCSHLLWWGINCMCSRAWATMKSCNASMLAQVPLCGR